MSMVRKGKDSDRYRHNQDIKDLPKLKAELQTLTSAQDLGRNAAKIDEKTPSLNSTGKMSVAEARALLTAVAAEYAKKPLEAFEAKSEVERKSLKDKEHHSFFAFVAERDRPWPKKGFFESASKYELRLQAQQERRYELSAKHSKEQEALANHTEQTQAERNKILGAAQTAAEQKHPEAVAVIKQDKERKQQEQERKATERKLQREAQQLRRGGRTIER